jgi:sugar/nucleoside kinase (ribokinase family)
MILMDQVDEPETGVVTRAVCDAAFRAQQGRPELLVLADSRRGLTEFPPVAFKMNAAELARLSGDAAPLSIDQVMRRAADLSGRNRKPVFVTLAESGIVGADADGVVSHVHALPVRGPIDIVGAGDSVTANLAAALAAKATLTESMALAMAGASAVIHQLGTTGESTRDALLEWGATAE